MWIAVRQFVITVSVVGLLCHSTDAAAVGSQRPASNVTAEHRLLVDACDGSLDESSLTRAALLASGVSEANELNRLECQINQLAAELGSSVLFDGDPVEKVRVLHEFLHAHVLHRYDAGATDLRRMLDEGIYNCVTSTVVYLAVGRQCGLDLVAEQSRGHVRCVLRTADEELTIETTQAKWTASSTTTPLRRLRQPELLSMFYFNRAHGLHTERRFDEAVAALTTARRLDPLCPEVQGNLLATLHNWALSLDEAGDPQGADRIRQVARQLADDHP